MDRLNSLTAMRLAASLVAGTLLGIAAHLCVNAPFDGGARLPFAACAGGMTMALAVIALNGPLALPRALVSALGLGILIVALFAVAKIPSLHALVERDVAPQIILAWAFLTFAVLPVLRAADRWRDYGALWAASFEQAIVWIAGLSFVGLSWAVILLGVELLELVGLPAREVLHFEEVVSFVISGLLLGAGVAVLSHWPLARAGEVLARVARLLAPPFLAVMTLFCVALIANGVTAEGRASAALMSWSTLFSALLISAIAGPSGRTQATSRFWRVVAGGLMLLMVPTAAAALWRVFGTLQREALMPQVMADVALSLLAATLAIGYGLTRLGARSVGGMNKIALGLVTGWALLILSGALSPEALAVRDHLARLSRGETTLGELPLRHMSFYWGSAGRSGIETLRQRLGDDPAAVAQIDVLTQTTRPPLSLPPASDPAPILRQELAGKLQVLPKDSPLLADFVFRWDSSPEALQRLIAACDRRTPAGHPGCLVVAGDFLPQAEGSEMLLFSLEPGEGENGRVTGWQRQGAETLWRRQTLVGDMYRLDAAEAIDRLHSEGPVIRPVAAQSLTLGDMEIFFRPQPSHTRITP